METSCNTLSNLFSAFSRFPAINGNKELGLRRKDMTWSHKSLQLDPSHGVGYDAHHNQWNYFKPNYFTPFSELFQLLLSKLLFALFTTWQQRQEPDVSLTYGWSQIFYSVKPIKRLHYRACHVKKKKEIRKIFLIGWCFGRLKKEKCILDSSDPERKSVFFFFP